MISNSTTLKITASLLLSILLHYTNASTIDEETLQRKLNNEPLYEIVDRSEDELESVPLIERQFPKIEQHTSDLNLALLNEIQFSTLRCRPDSCDGSKCNCKAGFCKTNIDDAQENPEKFPTFNQVLDSEYCNAQQKTFDLNNIYDEIQNYDQTKQKPPLPIELIIFDMGNTKAAERFGVPLKIALPTKKIVSNARALTDAMTICDNIKNKKKFCNKEAVKDLTKKVSNLLCRDSNPNVDGCVLLLSSDASESLSYLDLSVVPVAYVYGPAELILSDYPFALDRAPCNKYKVNRSDKVNKVITEKGRDAKKKVSAGVNCAATTAANMKELLEELNHEGKRYSVNTLDLPYALYSIINDVWGIDNLTEKVKDDMVDKSSMDNMFGIPFHTFLEKKGQSMTDEMKKLANEFMEPMYEELDLEEFEEEDSSGYVRNLKKKIRMTDWPH